MNKPNYFIANHKRPFHLSVGVVPFNKKKEILIHYYPIKNELKEIYWLAHKSLIPKKTIEETALECLLEELGGTGEVIMYLGARNSTSHWVWSEREEADVEKTTVYLLIKVESFNPEKLTSESPESNSEKIWIGIDDLIAKQKLQIQDAPEYVKSEFDETKILERVKEFFRFI